MANKKRAEINKRYDLLVAKICHDYPAGTLNESLI